MILILRSVIYVFLAVCLHNSLFLYDVLSWQLSACFLTILDFLAYPGKIESQKYKIEVLTLLSLVFSGWWFFVMIEYHLPLQAVAWVGCFFQGAKCIWAGYEWFSFLIWGHTEAEQRALYQRVLKMGTYAEIEKTQERLNPGLVDDIWVELDEIENRLKLSAIESQYVQLLLPKFYHLQLKTENGMVKDCVVERIQLRLTMLQYLTLYQRADVLEQYSERPLSRELLILALRLRDAKLVDVIRHKIVGSKVLKKAAGCLIKREHSNDVPLIEVAPLVDLEGKPGLRLPSSGPELDDAVYALKGAYLPLSYAQLSNCLQMQQDIVMEQAAGFKKYKPDLNRKM